jgi:hypothetical protein
MTILNVFCAKSDLRRQKAALEEEELRTGLYLNRRRRKAGILKGMG